MPAEVSVLNPIYFPQLESCVANFQSALIACVDLEYEQKFYTGDVIRFQARLPLAEVAEPLVGVYNTDSTLTGFLTQTSEDVGDFRIYDFEFDTTNFVGEVVCFGIAKVTAFLEVETIDVSWPVKIVDPPDGFNCLDYCPIFTYTDCGAGPGTQYWDQDGDRVYSLRLPVAIQSSSYASTVSTVFSSLGPGSSCNSVHDKTVTLGTWDFIPEWLAIKFQLAASLDNFQFEGTKYILNGDPTRAEASGFGTYNFEFSLLLANRLRKSACC